MPTTNPVPSQDPSDLLFNAGKLDEVLNGTGTSFTDRLGTARRTVAGMNADFDAQLADAESDLNVYRSDAAASAAEALGYLQTIRATSYGAYASDPATDPLGNPPTVGDEYFNTTANLLKRWNGTTWQASDINTANFAAPSGSSLMGHQQDGAGAVPTTVRNMIRLKVSVFEYMTPAQIADVESGAGLLDVSAAIQAADLATRGKQILLFPGSAKKFYCANSLYIGRGSKWEGENEALPDYRTINQNVSKIKFAAGVSGVLVDQADIELGYVWNISISNIFIEGGSRTTSPFGVFLRNVANSRFKNIGITNFAVGLKITNGMLNTFDSVASQLCGVTALLMTDEDGVTTSQKFVDSIFRESPWGIQMHTSGNYLLGTVFDHCSIESTTVGGADIHKGCAVTFIEPYFENVADYRTSMSGTAIQLYVDGVSSRADTLSICNIFGGDIAGPNTGTGFANALIYVGAGAASVNIFGGLYQRALHGIQVDPACKDRVVSADRPSFSGVTNTYTGLDSQRNGVWPLAVLGSSAVTLRNFSGRFGAPLRTDADTLEIRSSSNSNHYTQHSAADISLQEVNAVGSGGSGVSYRIQIQNAGTKQEVARFRSNGYTKFTATGAFLVPNYVGSSADAVHQVLADSAAQALIVSNLSALATAHCIRTTKPDTINGFHYLASRTDTAANVFQVAANGNVTNTNNIYAAISDAKLKQDIVDAVSQWNDIKALSVKKYRLKDYPEGPMQMGLIAQEVEAVSPGLVEETPDMLPVEIESVDDDGNVTKRIEYQEAGTTTKSIKYSIVNLKMLKALQEAMDRIEVLEAEIQALKQ